MHVVGPGAQPMQHMQHMQPMQHMPMQPPMTPQMHAYGAGGGAGAGGGDVPEDLGMWIERKHPENGTLCQYFSARCAASSPNPNQRAVPGPNAADYTFFYNPRTGVSTYEKPTWVDVQAPDGRVYYQNSVTQVRTWERPPDFIPIKRLAQSKV